MLSPKQDIYVIPSKAQGLLEKKRWKECLQGLHKNRPVNSKAWVEKGSGGPISYSELSVTDIFKDKQSHCLQFGHTDSHITGSQNKIKSHESGNQKV